MFALLVRALGSFLDYGPTHLRCFDWHGHHPHTLPHYQVPALLKKYLRVSAPDGQGLGFIKSCTCFGEILQQAAVFVNDTLTLNP